MAACAICNAPLDPIETSGGEPSPTCERVECRRASFMRRRRSDEKQRRLTVLEQATALRGAAAAALGLDPADYPITLTPSIERPLTPLPEARRNVFLAHLAAVVAQAVERGPSNVPARDPRDEAALEPPSPELGAVLGAACGTCRGSCCRNGGERAFLSAETMQRHMLAHPERDAADVTAAYVAHLPPRSIEASCVFHGIAGCALPRDMRSDTCNRFYCGALHELDRAVTPGTRPRAFVAASEGDAITGASFLEPDVRHVVLETRRDPAL